MGRRELIKVVVEAVMLERDDQGEIVTEQVSGKVACYSAEEAATFFAQARMEVDAWNAAQPNRAQRRRTKKEAR